DDAVAARIAGELDGDDIEPFAALKAQRGGTAVIEGGKAAQHADLLELAHRVERGLLELPGDAALQRAIDGAAVGGRKLLGRQQTLEQLAKIDVLPLHRASLPPCRAAQVRIHETLR